MTTIVGIIILYSYLILAIFVYIMTRVYYVYSEQDTKVFIGYKKQCSDYVLKKQNNKDKEKFKIIENENKYYRTRMLFRRWLISSGGAAIATLDALYSSANSKYRETLDYYTDEIKKEGPITYGLYALCFAVLFSYFMYKVIETYNKLKENDSEKHDSKKNDKEEYPNNNNFLKTESFITKQMLESPTVRIKNVNNKKLYFLPIEHEHIRKLIDRDILIDSITVDGQIVVEEIFVGSQIHYKTIFYDVEGEKVLVLE